MENPQHLFVLEEKGDITLKFIMELFEDFIKDIPKRTEILNFLENCPYRLPCSEEDLKGLDKENNRPYCLSIFKMDKECYKIISMIGSKDLHINLYEKIDINHYNQIAVRNLTNLVDEELSLGDRKIIRDVALQSFHKSLEISCDREAQKTGNLEMCVATNMDVSAINQLLSYGFKLNLPKEKKYFIIYK